MNWKLLLEKAQKHYDSELPFVLYKKPNAKVVQSFFQKTTEIHSCNFLEDGFIFAPFSKEKQTFFFPKNHCEFIEIALPKGEENSKKNSQDFSNSKYKEEHINLVEKGVKAIQQQQFKKVVLSRKESVDLSDFDVFSYFKRLLSHYPSAFTYLWYHPEVGFWSGATPETLVSVTNETFSTMALAGTQLYEPDKEVVWQDKELEEQQIVTDYIVNKLEKIVQEVKTSEVKTVKAGNLLHLQTQIYGNLGKAKLLDVIRKLHPTPAVCGFPTDKARQFIETNENYDREYYSGYFGEINLEKTSQLFVNLRCMKFLGDKVSMYVGGGITGASNPEKEWEETVNKLGTVGRIL